MRVLMWILDRAEGKAEAVESAIGYLPKAEDINLEGLDMTVEDVKNLLDVDNALWAEDAASLEEFYAKFEGKIPAELQTELENLKKRIS
jgi:phosphoenolpyruvate carboxykinase (GTP)